MNKKLNIIKEFIIDNPFEDTVSILDLIVSHKYENSIYSTFGNVISSDPPVYSLMTKWYSIFRPPFAEIASTKIRVKIFPVDNKSKISITTKTNPAFYMYFLVFVVLSIAALLTLQNFGTIALYVSFTIMIIILDRWKKHDLVARFERDIKIKIIK